VKSRVILVGILAFALTAPGGMEKVEAQQKTTCEATFDNMDIAPGFWREGNSGTFTTNGETGKVTCNGPVNGKQPTGPGTWSASGRYGTKNPDTCDNAEGTFENSMTLPTADGKLTAKNKGDWAAGAFKGGGAFGGEFTGDTGDGTFEVTPKKGDCVASPMTQIKGVVRWTQKG
jgi:hypothetical protein